MGDGVLAVFSDKEIDGVMVSSAEQAVSAGKMICTLIDYCLNPKLKEKFNRIIGCGIGICTGTVLATKVGMRGNEGKPDVENETGIIWIGSCTNYASKYCGVANAGEIVIDKKTYSNITDNANWRLTQKIKGDVIYSCFVSQQNYMDIETDNEAICLGTDIVHSSVGVQINETQMRIEQDFIDSLESDLLPTPKRKRVPRPDEEKYREYRTATNYYDYAKDLCVNYLVDMRKYKFSKNYYDDFIALSKKEMAIVYEDLKFIKTCFQTVLRDYAEFFNERFIKRLSIRKYAEAHNMNRGSVENIQRKMYKKLSALLYERDQADGIVRIKTTE